MAKAVWSPPQVCQFNGNLKKQWYVHFRFTDPGSGIRKQFRFKKGINYFHTLDERRREATALKKELSSLLKDGWNPFKNEVDEQKSIGDLCHMMWEIKIAELEKESIRTYIYKYRFWVEWLKNKGLYNLSPGEFTTSHAFQFLDHCTVSGKRGTYWNSYRQLAFSLLDMIRERELITTNPFSKTKDQKKSTGTATVFAAHEIRMVRKFTGLKYPELRVFCDYIYYTFMRPKELLLLKIKHIDFERMRITLPPDIAKNDTHRTVILPPALRKHARELQKNLQSLYDHYSKEWPKVKAEEYYLFGIKNKGAGPQPSPRPYIRRDSLTTMFREKVRKPLRLSEEHTLYVFKHSGVEAALRAGLTIPAAMKQTGHKSLKNFQIYMRSLNQQDNPEFETAEF